LNILWDSKTYEKHFSFVPQYGENVLNLITKPSGCTAVDLGCGNGTLTAKLFERGFQVTGIDASEEMLFLARTNHPHIPFLHGDALSFQLDVPADLIFSNSVFHWIDKNLQETLLRNIAKNLSDDGELVCEFGGYGCAEAVHGTLEKCFEKRGFSYPRTVYFPTIGEYAPLLERCGFRVESATLFDRPTPQNAEVGLLGWIDMFIKPPFNGMDPLTKNAILEETAVLLKSKLFCDELWYIDYVRIQIRARKTTRTCLEKQ